MTWRISTELIDRIVAAAAASPGLEVCGLLLGDAAAPVPCPKQVGSRPLAGGTVTALLPCGNVAADPARAFEIDPAALFGAHRAARAGGPAILGCYHSHPSGRAEPSPRDAAQAEPNGWLWAIAAAGEARLWQAVENGPWLGRFTAVQGSA